MTTTTYRDEMLTEANRKREMALKAHRAGDMKLRDAFLSQARDRYRAIDMDGMATWCERFLGTPA